MPLTYISMNCVIFQWSQVPWLAFVKSGPVWAIIIGNFCTDWGLYTFLTNIPTFYKEVLNFDITSVSFILIDMHLFLQGIIKDCDGLD